MTLEEAKRYLGAPIKPLTDVTPITIHAEQVPDSFDSRDQWPNCIHPIRDQAQCGSCWAFAASEVLSDRYCIASNGATNVVLSPQALVSCDKSDYGCQGGYLDRSWNYLAQTGIPTDECYPYTSGGGVTGTCKTSCHDGSAFVMYKAKAGSIVTPHDVTSIQTLIQTSGPVEAGFSVYNDFFSYKSGVYQHKTGSLAGGHAIKIIGWGVDTTSKLPYWIVANSWNTTWGMNGFFWILRGKNECGIESNVIAGAANV